jgi:hypothetical protein
MLQDDGVRPLKSTGDPVRLAIQLGGSLDDHLPCCCMLSFSASFPCACAYFPHPGIFRPSISLTIMRSNLLPHVLFCFVLEALHCLKFSSFLAGLSCFCRVSRPSNFFGKPWGNHRNFQEVSQSKIKQLKALDIADQDINIS